MIQSGNNEMLEFYVSNYFTQINIVFYKKNILDLKWPHPQKFKKTIGIAIEYNPEFYGPKCNESRRDR